MGGAAGRPLTKWGWRGRGRFVMTFSDVFLPVPFLASPFDLHRITVTVPVLKFGGINLITVRRAQPPTTAQSPGAFASLQVFLFNAVKT